MARLPDTSNTRSVLAHMLFCLYGMSAMLVFGIAVSLFQHRFRAAFFLLLALVVVVALIWLLKSGRHVPDSWRTPVESKHPDHRRTPLPWE